MKCSDFYELADSYLSDELPGQNKREALQHLEGCIDCRRELAARHDLRAQLRAAVLADPAYASRKEYVERLRADLRAEALAPTVVPQARPLFGGIVVWPVAIAAVLLVAVGIGLFMLPQRRSSPPLAAGAPGAISHSAAFELSEFAIGNHRDCAVKFNLPEDPIDLEEAGHKYDRAYLNLTDVVKTQSAESAGQFEFIDSHSCIFKGQRFAHIEVKHRGRLVSLLVAEHQQETRATPAAQMDSTEDARRQVNACPNGDGYNVSCFQTARHAVFIVSDLSETENLAVARAFAPSLQKHITRAENAA